MRGAVLPLSLTLLAFAVGAGGCEGEDPDGCPPAGLELCDPVADRCCEGGARCVLSYSSGSFGEACVGGLPEAAPGEPCRAYATSGAEACVSGSLCLQVTGVDPAPVCRALCRSESDCPAGECSYELVGVSAVRACL